jgi:hypothetical protein
MRGSTGRRASAPGRRASSPGRRATAPARRVSGPVGGRMDGNAVRRLRLREAPRDTVALGGRALALVRGLPDHSLIDRLVRGRAWIPVLGILLAGIVAMQVEILKLGTSMGRAIERSASLQTQNESLQARVAGLADDQRIERLAAGMGMVMPAPGALVFLHLHPNGDVGRAVAGIRAPDPAGFASQLAAQAATLAATMPAVPATTSSTGSPSTTVTTSSTGSPSTTVTTSATGTPATSVGTTAATSAPSATPTTATPTTTTPTTTSATNTSATTTTTNVSGAASLAPSAASQPTSTGGG